MLIKGLDGVYRPSSGSPLKDAAEGSWSTLVGADLDGFVRAGTADVGAFEIGSTAAQRKPLTEKDVGPWWLGNVSDPNDGNVSVAIRIVSRTEKRLGMGAVQGLKEARDVLGRLTSANLPARRAYLPGL